MAIRTSPFSLKHTSITLKLVGSADAAQEYRCQLTEAVLTPSESGGGGGGNTLSTFCNDYSDQGAASTTWVLTLSGFQSYADANDFSLWAFEHESEKADFVLVPGMEEGPISATNPGFSGTVTVKPTVIGGTAKQYAVFQVSLPLDTKPALLKTAPAVL